jgi:protocadherin Fat 1/2/3
LDNVDLLRVEDETNGNYYMFPKFLRTYQCICNEGFGGQKCDVALNKCSREMCTKYEMCVPSDNEPTGFSCVCPPGLKGDRCATPTCEKASECSQKESISLLGNGYFQLFIAQSLEARMELLLEFKTVSRNAYLMHDAGAVDFHSILIDNGYVEYRWNCGSGLGQVKIPHIRVDDGQWHTLKIMRRGRQVKLMLDNNQAEGASPPGSDVVNLYAQATVYVLVLLLG